MKKAIKEYLFRLTNEEGSVLILAALLMTALVALTGVVVDGGTVYMEKQKIQVALDAAALAGGQELPDTTSAANTALYYAELNGLDSDQVQISFPTNGKIVVETNRRVELRFMPIVNINTVDLDLRAAAAMGAPKWAGYTLFSASTSDTLRLSGNTYSILGSAHTNQNFRANGNTMTITGIVDALGSITVNGNAMNIPNRYPNSNFIELPDYTAEVQQQAETVGTVYNAGVHFNGNSIDVNNPIYVNGDVHMNGNHITGNGAILADGDIHINGNCLKNTTSDAVCLYSTGDIHINGNDIEVCGILYAPNGTIFINGNNIEITGKVIGNEVSFSGNTISIIDDDSALKALPGGGSRLVE